MGSRSRPPTLGCGSTWRPPRPTTNATTSVLTDYVDYQLDSLLDKHDPALRGLRMLPGLQQRLYGGQAVVQMAEDVETRTQYAMKFFLYEAAFLHEKHIYEDDSRPLGKFLPRLRCILEGSLKDGRGERLPPCIVMEKGTSLEASIQASKGGVDMATGIQVLMHISARLKALHEAGYVHRDIKPGNIMWLPRQNRWTLIDFGCAARTGERAPVTFSLTYAPPEVVAAWERGGQEVRAAEGADAWSVGILAVEMLTGEPAFERRLKRKKVVAMIMGSAQAPWENPDKAPGIFQKLGIFRRAVMSLLKREPAARPSMADFHHECRRVLSTTFDRDYLEEEFAVRTSKPSGGMLLAR